MSDMGYDRAANIGRLEGDLSDVYRIPGTSVLRKDGEYRLIFCCHLVEARRDEVLIGIEAKHVDNGRYWNRTEIATRSYAMQSANL